MNKTQDKKRRRQRAHRRIRSAVSGTADRPRLAVYKSCRYVYAQVIDDMAGHTLAQASSAEAELRAKVEGGQDSKPAARLVGEVVAERARELGIERVVFDRGGYVYHGRVKELAEGARANGLEF
jgi:large subunit ribosomal protein L18